MRNKKGAIIAPLPDFIGYLIGIVVILFFFLLFAITKSCMEDSAVPPTIDETRLQAEYLLLDFLKTPVNIQNPLGPSISEENMADLIVASSPQLNSFVEECAQEYFSNNYYKWWEIKITYPNGHQETIETLYGHLDETLFSLEGGEISNLLLFGPITSLHLENYITPNQYTMVLMDRYKIYGDKDAGLVSSIPSNEHFIKITVTEVIPTPEKELITIQLTYERIPNFSLFANLK